MIISNDLISRFREARFNHNSAEADYSSTDDIRAEKRRIWSLVRSTYNIPENVKLKVELDGARAGELRYKDTGEVYGAPEVCADTAPDVTPTVTTIGATPSVVIDTSRIVLVDGNNIAHICTSLEDLISRMDDGGLLDFATYRVATQ